MPQFEHIGKLLRAVRKKRGLTQEQLAYRLGIKLSRLQKWEAGVNSARFTVPELRRLYRADRELFDAVTSGFLLVPPPPIVGVLGHET